MFINRAIILLVVVLSGFAAACSGSSVSTPPGTDGDLDTDSSDALESGDSDTSSDPCTPDSLRCATSGKVEMCRTDGEGWSYYRTCPEGRTCENGECALLPDGDSEAAPSDGDVESELETDSIDGDTTDAETDAETQPPVDGNTEADTSDADSVQPGTLGGACIDGLCLTGLECQGGVCVTVDGDADADTVDTDSDTDTEPGLYGVTWVSIPAGSFLMGAPEEDADGLTEVLPQHFVTVRAFQMMATTATATQVLTALGGDTEISGFHTCEGGGTEATCPAAITYAQAQMFCYKVGGRLPSEAEYEYAARAGTTAKFYCSNTDSSCLASYEWLYGDHTHPVGLKLPNAWGLYDMLGNWQAWTADCWHPTYADAPTDGSPWITNCVNPGGLDGFTPLSRAVGMAGSSNKYRAVWARLGGGAYGGTAVRCAK